MSYVILRPRTEEANAVLEQFGDVWEVQSSVPQDIYGSSKQLHLNSRSDLRSKSMWVDEKYDDLFEVIRM